MTNKMLSNMFIATENGNYLFYPNGKKNSCYRINEKTKKAILRGYQCYFIFLFLAMVILGYIEKFLPLLLIFTIPIFNRIILYLYCNNDGE